MTAPAQTEAAMPRARGTIQITAMTDADLAREMMHVVARVGNERFAFRVIDVEEAIDAPALLPVLNAPAGMSGQFEHRGRMVSAFDSAWMFDVPRFHQTRKMQTAIVLRVAADRLALLVDDVEDLAALDSGAVRPTPAGTDPFGLLRGVCLPRAESLHRDRRGHDRRQAQADAEPEQERRVGQRRAALICIVNAVAVVARAAHVAGAGDRAGTIATSRASA